MSITKVVLEYMQKYHGVEVSAEDVRKGLESMYPGEDITREQVSNALADHAAWSRITRVRRGVYVGKQASAILTTEAAEPDEFMQRAGSIEQERMNQLAELEARCFSQVGHAQDGALIITRDSDGAAFRATPL